MARKPVKERNRALYECIMKIDNVDDCIAFFEDLCAVTELTAIEQRFEVASMLINDKVYAEVMAKTNASSATVSRVNRVLYSGNGMLEKFIDKE